MIDIIKGSIPIIVAKELAERGGLIITTDPAEFGPQANIVNGLILKVIEPIQKREVIERGVTLIAIGYNELLGCTIDVETDPGKEHFAHTLNKDSHVNLWRECVKASINISGWFFEPNANDFSFYMSPSADSTQ